MRAYPKVRRLDPKECLFQIDQFSLGGSDQDTDRSDHFDVSRLRRSTACNLIHDDPVRFRFDSETDRRTLTFVEFRNLFDHDGR